MSSAEAVQMPVVPAEVMAELRAKVIAELFPVVEAKVRQELSATPASPLLQVIPPHPTGTGAYDAANNPKTVKVQVSVAPRPIPNAEHGECYPGIGAGHVFWPNGTTEAMVTERQYQDLLAHRGALTVINLGELEAAAKANVEADLQLKLAGIQAEKSNESAATQAKRDAEAKAQAERASVGVPKVSDPKRK